MFKKEKVSSGEVGGQPDDANCFSKHHRKPKSEGGANFGKNISRVRLYKHRAWHALYQELPASEVIRLFTQDYEVFGTDFVKSPLMKELHERWANNTDKKIKRTQAWYMLFADMTLEEIVAEINTTWLDPEYEILIGLVRVKTIISRKTR